MRFNILKKILILITAVSGFTLAADIMVSAIGRGPGKDKIAKEQALADALRNAVRHGAGVNILSSTKVTDYILDYDRIFCRAFGYVKSYQINRSYVDKAGLFTVEINALVGQGNPELNDYMSMRQIIAMKGSPRLLIRCAGRIKNIGDSGTLIAGQLREIALKCGFQTVSLSTIKAAENKRVKHDMMSGKLDSAMYRKAGIRENFDFVIDAAVNGEYNGASELYGITTRRYSIGADLAATYPNGNIIAQVALPSKETDIARVLGPEQAARSALMSYLGGEKGRNFRALLMNVLSAWISEFDTGRKLTVEISGIGRKSLDNLITDLRGAVGITAVYLREFDAENKSTIEVNSLLEPFNLSVLLEKTGNGKLKTERVTADYIQMTVTVSGGRLSWGTAAGIICIIIAVLLTLLFVVRKKRLA